MVPGTIRLSGEAAPVGGLFLVSISVAMLPDGKRISPLNIGERPSDSVLMDGKWFSLRMYASSVPAQLRELRPTPVVAPGTFLSGVSVKFG